MDKRIKALWIDALESGEYQQGKGYLTWLSGGDGRQHCCLGVLCDVAEKEGVVTSVDGRDLDQIDGVMYYGNDTAFLPGVVQRWAGLESESGTFGGDPIEYNRGDGPEYARDLINLNDAAGYDFKQIAEVIREKF